MVTTQFFSPYRTQPSNLPYTTARQSQGSAHAQNTQHRASDTVMFTGKRKAEDDGRETTLVVRGKDTEPKEAVAPGSSQKDIGEVYDAIQVSIHTLMKNQPLRQGLSKAIDSKKTGKVIESEEFKTLKQEIADAFKLFPDMVHEGKLQIINDFHTAIDTYAPRHKINPNQRAADRDTVKRWVYGIH